jgi:hypothetical protein
MNDDRVLERQVVQLFHETAPFGPPDDLLANVITTASRRRRRPRWLALLKEPPMRISSHVAVGSPAARLSAIVLVSLLMVVLATGAVVAAASLLPSPEQVLVAAPVEVTVTSAAGPCPVSGVTQTVRGVSQVRGGECHPVWLWSDERLNGTVTWSSSEDQYLDKSGLGLSMWAISIENEGGTWRMRPAAEMWSGSATAETTFIILDGEGTYAGMTALIDSSASPPSGFIIETEFPPAPENASTK